jgi:hypothetical protein
VLSLDDRFLLAAMSLFVLLFVLLNERDQVERTLSDENNFAIFNATLIVFALDNATLSNSHRFEKVVATNVNLTLALSLKSDDSVVVETLGEGHVVSVTSVGKLRDVIEGLVPLVALELALHVINSTFPLVQDLDARENFARRQQNCFKDLSVSVHVVVIDSGVVEECRDIILHVIEGLHDDVGSRWDKGVNLTVGAFTNLEENDGAFADDLVDYQRGHDHEEDRAEGQDVMELATEDVLVGVLDEELDHLI